MKQPAWKQLAAAMVTAILLTASAAAATAASPIPSKTKTPDASTSIYAESTSSAKATSGTKSTSSAKATSSAKSTSSAKATSNANASSSPEATGEAGTMASVSPEPVMNVVASQDQLDAKKYLSKGGAFGWFIVTVLVSAMISFLISYRFYKMSRKDNHLAAEIRALKKDIDSKMQGTIGGFSEYETKITNHNPSYARRTSTVKSTAEEDSDDEKAQEIYRKWENQILSSKEREAAAQRGSKNPRRQEGFEQEQSRSASVKDKMKGAIDDFFNK